MLNISHCNFTHHLGTIIGFTAAFHNNYSASDVYPVYLNLFSLIHLRQQMKVIWQLPNDVNFINEDKQQQQQNAEVKHWRSK